ncbi:MAG: helix-turn-helix transcriptional regulator [Actinomycetota bacterium]|nr:helix-turn-helix transcriptional regulator [Actinomycetota bacterium]
MGSPVSDYREWLPPPEWRNAVLCQWEQRVTGGRYVQRVLPDGCADIIVDPDGRAIVAGPAIHVLLPHLEPGTLRGLRLRSEAIGPVFGLAGSELFGITVAIDAVIPARRARAAVRVLMADDDSGAWWAHAVIDPRVGAACAALRHARGSVAEVADNVGLSSRQLRRLLLAATGQGPKTLQRVGRLQRFVALADQVAPPWRLAELAAVAGYADQAHLCREVRDLAGATPVDLLRERRPTAQHLLGAAVTSGEEGWD